MRQPLWIAASLLAGLASAAEPAPATPAPATPAAQPPEPEFLEFLGETVGTDPEVILFMESREAKKAVKEAVRKEPEEDDDE